MEGPVIVGVAVLFTSHMTKDQANFKLTHQQREQSSRSNSKRFRLGGKVAASSFVVHTSSYRAGETYPLAIGTAIMIKGPRERVQNIEFSEKERAESG